MKSFHSNIAIFVPHIGCPNRCVFCNQCHITGQTEKPTEKDVDEAVKTATNSKKYDSANTEIAFFGGSFTAIDEEYMLSLLKTAYKYVENGTVKGIRISTRPDAIDEKKLEILKKYGVTSIELGAQSMFDDVLFANKRGHTALDVVNSSKLIKEYGFSLGLQMMTGLYKSNPAKDYETAEMIADLNPETVRIYPTAVVKNTELYSKYISGEYVPETFENMVELCSKLLLLFEKRGIKVIRLGLHTVDKDTFAGGIFHPAFREMCESYLFFQKLSADLKNKGKYEIYVNSKELSKAIGQKKDNIKKLKENGYDCKIISDENIRENEYKIVRIGENR